MKLPHVLSLLPVLFLWAGCGGTTPAGPEDHHDALVQPLAREGGAQHSRGAAGEAHAHDEVPLGTAPVGDLSVTFAQGHGPLAAGAEGHLVVKLPYTDRGETIVRGWIGTEDRTLSLVAKAAYAASHDDYDLHALAPDPLPAGVRW